MESIPKLKWYFGTFCNCGLVYGRGGISEICIGGTAFGGLGMQYQPDVSSVSKMIEGSFTEEGTES